MRIRNMRASFGGLDNAELTLSDGLNVIQAPNEGGKSTWSAFLRAMLYGINTKERDKQGFIAEKNRYQPWTGGAMEGVMELTWQGKDVTLRRGPKGSSPFGKFEAVYTGTGEPVPGLTGENCGETLLGVPRDVFERSAFVGQGGVAIDGSPALEARAAALVSSGEEDVSYSQVERRLKDWRNRRQHNKTGLIPKLEGELAILDDSLARQAQAHRQAGEVRGKLDLLQAEKALLERESAVHSAQAQAEQRRKYTAAQSALEAAQAEAASIQGELARFGEPPDREALRHAQENLNYLNTLNANRKLAERQLAEAEQAAEQAKADAADELFPNMTPDDAWRQASEDEAGFHRKKAVYIPFGAAFLAVAAVLLAALLFIVPGGLRLGGICCAAGLAACGIILLVRGSLVRRRDANRDAEILTKYGVSTPDGILKRATRYREGQATAAQAEKQAQTVRLALEELTSQRENLTAQLLRFTRTFAPGATDTFGVSAAISRALGLKEKLAVAQARLEGARRLCDSLPRPQEGETQLPAGTKPRYDPAETAARLRAAEDELSRLRSELAMSQGELNTLGDPDLFRTRREELLEELERRRVEYEALTLALEGLEQAHGELQARFSPALSRKAGEIMAALTGGKYGTVTLTRQFEALAEEAGGLTPRRALTLSQGTADQLYLSVRLAVCALVLPGGDPAPLVLDDALANFDDERCALALDYLSRLGQERQILLFTCHSRENRYLAGRAESDLS